MFRFTVRRILFAVPTLLVISFIIFALLDLAPSDPTGNLPLTIPPEVREQIRQSLGLGEPFFVRYLYWLKQFFINEPLNILEHIFQIDIGDSSERLRVRSWVTRSPVVDLIAERLKEDVAEGKGRIELEDLRRVARELGEGLQDEELVAMIEEFDVRGEGGIDRDAFLGICLGT